MRKQSGFTLIELIVVIVILGILSAVAVPKFFSLESDARIANLRAMQGSLEAAATMTFAKATIEGKTSGNASVDIKLDGATSATTIAIRNGYPTNGSIDDLVVVSNQFVVSGSTFSVAQSPGGSALANCNVRYNQSAGVGVRPTYVLTTTGC